MLQSNSNKLVLNELAAEGIQTFTNQQSLSMLLSIFKEPSICDALFYECLHSLPTGFLGWPIALELNFLVFSSHEVHFESVFVLEEALDEFLDPFLVLVFLVLYHRFAFREIHLLFASQSENLVVEERSILIDKAEELISPFVLGIPLAYINASAVAKRQYGLALVVPGGCGVVLGQRKALLPHLDELAPDFLEVAAEADHLLQPGQRSHVEQVRLVVDEEVPHLIRFFVLVLAEQNPDSVVQAVHAIIIHICHQSQRSANSISMPNSFIAPLLQRLFCSTSFIAPHLQNNCSTYVPQINEQKQSPTFIHVKIGCIPRLETDVQIRRIPPKRPSRDVKACRSARDQLYIHMLNHNALFRQQLRRIATAVNKKHSVLRKEVIKTCEVFQNEQLPVFPYEVCFGLFRQVADTNSVSAGVLFLPFMQNVINLGFAHEQMTQQILNLLGQIKSLPKFQGLDLESKMQQTVLLLVSKHAITLFNLSCTHAIFNILMALDNPHSKMLWNKTLSIAVQISLLHLNQVADDPSPKKTELFKSYLSDMVQLARGEQVGWLTEPVEQFIFMALLGDLLDEKYLKLQKSQFREILTVLLSPLRRLTLKLYEATIFQIPTSPTKKWQVPVHNKLIICLRLACKIAVVYDSGFQLLEQIVKMVGQKAGAKGLGYECINYLFASPAWMHTMLQSSSGDLFNFVMTTLFNAVKHIQPDLKQGIDLIRSDLQRPPKLFSSNVLEVHFGELCPLGEVRALVRSIDEIVLTFFSIYSEVYHIELDRRLEGKAPLEKTFKFIQKTVFEIVKAVIGKEMTEQTLQSLLKTCQRIINLGGVVGDSSTALYIKLLCRHCLPGGLNNISLRHVQINKMILSTANCLGNLFSTACWVTLWKAFENYALYYNRYLRAQPNQRNSDVQILYASMDSIFVQSAAYDQAYLQTMLQSLVEATYECLENTYVEETKKIFAFERIQQVFRLNLHRLAKVWPPLVSSLLILTTSKVQQFRLASLALINTLVPVALHYLHTHPDAITEPFTSLNYETLLLQPWKHLAESPFNEVKAELALAVDKLVIDYGHIMGAGWGGLLSVVRSLADMTALQAIVQTYLDKIQPHMDFIVDCIDKVERSLSDTNQKYLCLTLIWAVGDHAYRRQMTPLLHKIFALLLKPEQTFCLGTQARHSSFYILAQLLVHNCDEKGEQFWNWVFKLVHSFVTFVVGKCSESREGIEEVIKNLLTNLLKIYRKCLIAVEGNSAFLVEQLGGFFDLATKLLQFRLSQIYHCTLRQSRELLAAAGTLATATKEFWSFLQKLTEVYFLQNDNKMLKLLITYLPVEIYDVLGYALGEIESRLSLVYKLVEKVFLLRLEAEEKDIKIAQMRIFFEEKSFNQFFKKLYVTVVDSNSSEIICSYHEKLIKTLHKLLLYEDQPFLVKLLPFLGSIADKHPQKLQYDAPIQLLRSLLLLKWSETWRKKHAKTKDPPVWLVATHESVRLGHTLASNLHQPNCQLPYAKLLAIEVQLLGRPPCASHEGGDPDFLMNFYDSQSTLLYFVVDNYFLNEKGTNIVTPQHQQQVMGILGEALASFKEGDRTSRAKNAYDVLFKAVKSRGQVCREVQDRQRELAGLLLRRVVTVLKSYSALQSQKRGSASDLEKETCFLLKQMLHLQTGQGTFEQQRPYLNTQMEVVAKQGSAVWKSRCGMILAAYPLLIELSGCGTAEVRELVKECLAIGVKSLFTQLSI